MIEQRPSSAIPSTIEPEASSFSTEKDGTPSGIQACCRFTPDPSCSPCGHGNCEMSDVLGPGTNFGSCVCSGLYSGKFCDSFNWGFSIALLLGTCAVGLVLGCLWYWVKRQGNDAKNSHYTILAENGPPLTRSGSYEVAEYHPEFLQDEEVRERTNSAMQGARSLLKKLHSPRADGAPESFDDRPGLFLRHSSSARRESVSFETAEEPEADSSQPEKKKKKKRKKRSSRKRRRSNSGPTEPRPLMNPEPLPTPTPPKFLIAGLDPEVQTDELHTDELHTDELHTDEPSSELVQQVVEPLSPQPEYVTCSTPVQSCEDPEDPPALVAKLSYSGKPGERWPEETKYTSFPPSMEQAVEYTTSFPKRVHTLSSKLLASEESDEYYNMRLRELKKRRDAHKQSWL